MSIRISYLRYEYMYTSLLQHRQIGLKLQELECVDVALYCNSRPIIGKRQVNRIHGQALFLHTRQSYLTIPIVVRK